MSIFICPPCGRVVYFMYVDGSGQTKIKRNSQNNGLYILSGVLVHEKDWRSVEKRLADVKRDIFPQIRPDTWELHAQEIWNSKKFFTKKELRLNLAKKEDIFQGLSMPLASRRSP